MFESHSIITSISYINPVMVASNSSDPLLWNLLILLLIIGGIILGALLFLFSKKPDDWKHTPIADEFLGGRLNYYANSVKLASADYSDQSQLKNHVQLLFFEKIGANCGLSTVELTEIKTKNPNALRSLINDNEIADWILNVKTKDEKKKFFRANKEEQKQKYISDLNSILNKMDVWGK